MIKAVIDGKERVFANEAALIAFQTSEDPRNANAVRQARWRKNHRNAATFWKVRIRTGRDLSNLLDGISDEVIEQERVIAIDTFPEFSAMYPDRCRRYEKEILKT